MYSPYANVDGGLVSIPLKRHGKHWRVEKLNGHECIGLYNCGNNVCDLVMKYDNDYDDVNNAIRISIKKNETYYGDFDTDNIKISFMKFAWVYGVYKNVSLQI